MHTGQIIMLTKVLTGTNLRFYDFESGGPVETWHSGPTARTKIKEDGQDTKDLSSRESQIINDVLIARTAKRAGVTVVTDNINDFEKIRKFCDVKIISGSKYFLSRPVLED